MICASETNLKFGVVWDDVVDLAPRCTRSHLSTSRKMRGRLWADRDVVGTMGDPKVY